jgi:type I restriction enzyme, S subunit
MKYQTYPAYKDSGVEWLGDVPQHWEIKKLKFIANVQPSNVDKKTNASEIPVLLCNYTDVYYNDTVNSAMEFMNASATEEQIKKFTLQAGDTIITKDSEDPNDIAIPTFVPKDMAGVICGYHLAIIRPYNVVNGAYIKRVFEANYARAYFATRSNGLTRYGLGTYPLDNALFPKPSENEAEKIAQFLDHETAKIDTLIEKQQRLIELLKEKRQAVISHAVTKGLNPNAPMKESGVEWLGDVPEGWIVKRLKHISPKIGVGLVINPSTYTRDEGVYFIFGGDVKEYEFDLSTTRRISEEDSNRLLPSRLNHRDLVCVRVGYPGITAVVTEELEGSNCASVIVIRRGDYNSDWLCAAMNMWVGRQQVELASYGAAQKQFNVADVIEFIFPVPLKQEQNKIADYVEKALVRFNTLSELAFNQIELLQERRTALISAAVTGKIDVRHWGD